MVTAIGNRRQFINSPHLVIRAAEDILWHIRDRSSVAAELAAEGRTGGYLCVLDAEGVQPPYLLVQLGGIPSEKRLKYSMIAQEKAARLASFPEHHSSWQSRDPANERYGGAIRGTGVLLSFSGFPEPVDEVLVLALAVACDELTADQVRAIARANANPYQTLLDELLI